MQQGGRVPQGQSLLRHRDGVLNDETAGICRQLPIRQPVRLLGGLHHRGPPSGSSGRQFPLNFPLPGRDEPDAIRSTTPVEYGVLASQASLNGVIGAKKVES